MLKKSVGSILLLEKSLHEKREYKKAETTFKLVSANLAE